MAFFLPVLLLAFLFYSSFVQHFVAFRFVGATPSDVQAVTDLYHSLLTKCPYIIDMKVRCGQDTGAEGQIIGNRDAATAYRIQLTSFFAFFFFSL